MKDNRPFIALMAEIYFLIIIMGFLVVPLFSTMLYDGTGWYAMALIWCKILEVAIPIAILLAAIKLLFHNKGPKWLHIAWDIYIMVAFAVVCVFIITIILETVSTAAIWGMLYYISVFLAIPFSYHIKNIILRYKEKSHLKHLNDRSTEPLSNDDISEL